MTFACLWLWHREMQFHFSGRWVTVEYLKPSKESHTSSNVLVLKYAGPQICWSLSQYPAFNFVCLTFKDSKRFLVWLIWLIHSTVSQNVAWAFIRAMWCALVDAFKDILLTSYSVMKTKWIWAGKENPLWQKWKEAWEGQKQLLTAAIKIKSKE